MERKKRMYKADDKDCERGETDCCEQVGIGFLYIAS